MKVPWEDKLPCAALALLVLAVFYGIYFAKMLRRSGAASRPGRSDAEGKKTSTPSRY